MAFFYWDPDPVLFFIPGLNHPVTWYGLCFALGFLGSYFAVRWVFAGRFAAQGMKLDKARLEATALTESLSWYIVIGLIVGARLGHVFFYDWPSFRAHPGEIVMVWKGGLASHGGMVGMLAAAALFRLRMRRKWPGTGYLALLDAIAVAAPLPAAMIRFGNFINQEIVGVKTDRPWAVLFGHAADGSLPAPRHPVQLYESFFYLALFAVMALLFRRRPASVGNGRLTGLLLVVVSCFRFGVEWLKAPQGMVLPDAFPLSMGQLLSVPFVILGAFLLFRRM